MTDCGCSCHGGGVYGECDIEGGCGHLHVEHRCARGDRCKNRMPLRDEAGAATGYFLAAQIEIPRGLCARCISDVEHALNHLTGDVVELTMHLGKTGQAGGVMVSSSFDHPVPIQVNLEALRAEIDSELQAWAEPVAEILGIEWDTDSMHRTRMAPRVQRAAHLLARSVSTLLALPETEHPAWGNGLPVWDVELGCQDTTVRDGVDGALHLIELHRRAYAALGRTEYVERLPHPCPWCNWITLIRRNGQDNVECENCHKIVRRELLDWLAKELIKAEMDRQDAVA